MRRFSAAALALCGITAAAMGATLGTSLGVPLWQYNASFVAAIVGAAGAWPILRTRRGATLVMAFTAVLATGTGFVMLFTRQFPYKEWITWWHSFTSFALLLVFLVHWLHNRQRLWILTRKLFAPRLAPALVGAFAWLPFLLLVGWTAIPAGRDLVRRENYLLVSSWTILVAVALTYGIWLVYRLPSLRERLARAPHRHRARALVDTSLFLAHWGALLTGFALLWIPVALDSSGLRYPSKWWHTATSVAFLALLTLHVGFNARLLAAHARRADGDLGGKGGPRTGGPAP